MKIGVKLILIIGLLTVVSVAASGFVYYFSAQEAIDKRTEAQLQTAAVLKESHIQSFINREVEEIEAIAAEKIFMDSFSYENINQILEERLLHTENFLELFVLDQSGKIIVSTDERHEGKIKSGERYFIEGKKKTFLQNFYYDIGLQQPTIAIATPIRESGGVVIGVLVGRLNLESISDIMVERSGLGETGETILVNKFNLLVSRSRFTEGIEFKKVIHTEGVNDCLKGNSGYKLYNDYRGVPVMSFYKWLPQSDVCIISKIDQNEAFEPVKELTIIVILACLGIIILSIFLASALAKAISGPIKKLTSAAKIISEGDLTKRVEIKSKDEIGQLALTFNKMAERLASYTGELERKIAERTKEINEKLKEIIETNSNLKETQGAMLNLLEDARILEGELSRENSRLNAVLASMGEGLFVVDQNQQVMLINQTAERMLMIKGGEVIGKNINTLFQVTRKEGTVEKSDDQMVCALTKGEACVTRAEDEIYLTTTQGKKFPIFQISTPLYDEAGKIIGAVIVFRDVSERKKLDESRTSFISIASHQLRTPLTSMRWFSEMLIAGDAGEINDTQKKFVERIYQGTDRMINLVNLLLQIARVEAGRVKVEPVPINFKNLIRGVSLALRSSISGKSQKLEVKINPDPFPIISMDQEVIWQVFQNLLSNASRYAPEKSTITVSIEKKDEMAEIAVIDKGIGIPKDSQSKIFEKFFRADNALKLVPEGSGLGLSLVRSLVEGWGGKIWFESKEGVGTTFYFTVPFSGMKAKEGEVTLAV
ncbi:MAG: ATP-binding protein [Patescibacteria group bacterium]